MRVSSTIIEEYNELCLHYNIIADSCYKERKNMEYALSDNYFPYIISALIVFDMQRQMGQGLEKKYNIKDTGFASVLRRSLDSIKDKLISLEFYSICDINLNEKGDIIKEIYKTINENIKKSNNHNFDVGVTKILHFLHPDLFPIIDSNAAVLLRKDFGVNYSISAPHNYSEEKYIISMREIQKFINEIGCESFSRLERGTPLTRIFDKIVFITNTLNKYNDNK